MINFSLRQNSDKVEASTGIEINKGTVRPFS